MFEVKNIIVVVTVVGVDDALLLFSMMLLLLSVLLLLLIILLLLLMLLLLNTFYLYYSLPASFKICFKYLVNINLIRSSFCEMFSRNAVVCLCYLSYVGSDNTRVKWPVVQEQGCCCFNMLLYDQGLNARLSDR